MAFICSCLLWTNAYSNIKMHRQCIKFGKFDDRNYQLIRQIGIIDGQMYLTLEHNLATVPIKKPSEWVVTSSLNVLDSVYHQ